MYGEKIKLWQGNHGNVREFKNCMSVATLDAAGVPQHSLQFTYVRYHLV
jgi:hypothetical protein